MCQNVERPIQCAGFAPNHLEWHIAKHDIYGEDFRDAWRNAGPRGVNPDDLEAEGQDDDIDYIDASVNGLVLDADD